MSDVGRKVNVRSGDNTVSYGIGVLEGYATVYLAQMPGGILRTKGNAERRPSRRFRKKIEKEGGAIVKVPDNPKIRLDNGDVVYGCQVWWSFADETADAWKGYA